MRVYALLLGILLTTGYGYAAQIAVSSLGAGRQPATEPAAVVPATTPDQVPRRFLNVRGGRRSVRRHRPLETPSRQLP